MYQAEGIKLQTITSRLRDFRQNRKGLSNIIVVVLSLVILVVIVANVVLWSYQMNQLDWERTNEDVRITDVARVTSSTWFVTGAEYIVNFGTPINGTYQDTQTSNDIFETFQEGVEGQIALRPVAAGQYAQWPSEYPSGSAHWSLCDEELSDNDNTYVENTAASWKRESYNLQDATESGTIDWVRVCVRARSVSSGSDEIRTLIRTYARDYEGGTVLLTSFYQDYYTQYNANPYTGTGWTWAEINSLEAGALSRKSEGTALIMTTAWVVLKYTLDTNYRFDMYGTFALDLSTYPISHIKSVDIQLRYRTSDTGEKWFLKAYDWTTAEFSDSGFNNTSGHSPTANWNLYAVNLADKWHNYVNGNGIMHVKLQDSQTDANQTTLDIDFLGVRAVINGTRFIFKNNGSRTAHLVSIWVNNATLHRRYDTHVFISPGETLVYTRMDISLPNDQYNSKVVTERGNTAVYTGG